MPASNPGPPSPVSEKGNNDQLNHPNTEGKEKRKEKKEKAVLDEKTANVLLKKGYEVEYKISQGSFGQVFTARNAKRGSIDAVKIMDLTKLSQRFKEKFLMREILTLIKVRHPNVLSVYDIFKSQQKIYIFMEFAGGGTLSDQIRKSEGGYLREDKAKFWFKQCADALQCMHIDHKICHRDIKVENVLMDENMNAKLSDFGFAREVGMMDNPDGLSDTWCGTEPYFSPELVEHRKYNPFAVDIWAMGVMLFAMLNGKFPFHFREIKKNKNIMLNEQRTRNYKNRPEVEAALTRECKDVIAKMLTYDPRDRPGIELLQQHPWMQG